MAAFSNRTSSRNLSNAVRSRRRAMARGAKTTSKRRTNGGAAPPPEDAPSEREASSAAIAPALIALALECERAGDPLGAIKALETVIANAKTRAKCLPQVEARCRVKLASLLLKHTRTTRIGPRRTWRRRRCC